MHFKHCKLGSVFVSINYQLVICSEISQVSLDLNVPTRPSIYKKDKPVAPTIDFSSIFESGSYELWGVTHVTHEYRHLHSMEHLKWIISCHRASSDDTYENIHSWITVHEWYDPFLFYGLYCRFRSSNKLIKISMCFNGVTLNNFFLF